MSNLRLDPVVLTFRAYTDKIDKTKFLSQENKPYNLIGTVTISDKEAYISATMGTFSTSVLRELQIELYKYGVEKVHWKHKDKKKTTEINSVY